MVTFDIGVKHAGTHWSASTFVFASRYYDKITPMLTGETMPGGRLVVQSRNTTRLDLAGLEADLRGTLRDHVAVYATATFTHGNEQLAGSEYPADRIPPLYGKVGALWHVSDQFALESYVYYAGRQDRLSPRDAVDLRIDPSGTDGWMSWNARAEYRAGRIGVALRLENLRDRVYREHGSGLEEPGFNAIVTLDCRL